MHRLMASDGSMEIAAAKMDDPRRWTRADSVLATLSLGLGVAPVVLIGIQWLLAWAVLGHRPVMWINDPSSISGVVSAFGLLAGISMVLLPPIWPWFAIFWFVRHGKSRLGKAMALASFLLPVASFVILNADPLGIVTWWFD